MLNAIELRDLKKHFGGVHALDGITFSIKEGGITSIVGPNGSGKTTLVNTLTGLYEMDGGVVHIGGAKLHKIVSSDLPQHGITRTFQEVRLFEQMTVLDNLLVVLTERNTWGALFENHTAVHEQRARELLERVGLWEKRAVCAAQLSYGQRKLLEIARALAMDVRVYLFDEPFAGLFREVIKTVVQILKDLRAAGRTVVLIEHNMDLIRELSDHLIVMDAGKILAIGDPAQVLSRPDVIEAYLGQ